MIPKLAGQDVFHQLERKYDFNSEISCKEILRVVQTHKSLHNFIKLYLNIKFKKTPKEIPLPKSY